MPAAKRIFGRTTLFPAGRRHIPKVRHFVHHGGSRAKPADNKSTGDSHA
jgi:hypothetical protein